MLFVGERRQTVRYHYCVEVQHHGVPAGGFTAYVGFGTCDKNILNTPAPQNPLQRRGSGNKCAVAVLKYVEVIPLHIKPLPRQCIGATRREAIYRFIT